MNADGVVTALPRSDLRNLARRDLQIIGGMIGDGSRVLDIGCGDGALLDYLVHQKGVDGRGIELSQAGVNSCVAHGLSVIQGDADTDLAYYPDDAFDYVVLTRTLQATRNPRDVVSHLVRIGGHSWHDTPNIHLCTIRDFSFMCDDLGLTVQRALSLSRHGTARELNSAGAAANIRGEEAIFLLTRE